MGNIHAQSTVPPPPPPPPPGFVPPPDFKDGANSPSTQATASPRTKLDLPTNPGPLEDIHKCVKELAPVLYEGGRLIFSKGLSNHFQVTHTLNITNTKQTNGYRFGATYCGNTLPSSEGGPPEPEVLMSGDMDPSGNTNAHCMAHITNNLKGKMVIQIQDGIYGSSQFSGEYRGTNYTATLMAANIDLNSRSGILVGQYLQNVQPRLALGAEWFYQYAPQIPGGSISVMSVAGRYTGDNYVIAGTLGTNAVHASYYMKTNESTQVGVEVETNLRMGESLGTLAYQFDVPKANLVFRGMVDSTWTVGAVMEKKLTPLPFTFSLSAMLNHAKAQSRFGVGLIIG
ncbi:mitochondrial import receptor subunit TOM401-like [Tropilaelaps mercedesae]|uniref:Mitochondrial import receptor subunit TOM401-like n=1 Tax=Tropilaelaps mercedesae TaxID=418985 RepID=A0A1V9XI75_9ACAR|nr:mitochondrial import receptor subunit TOM401-like [Tropilaelaps mercedesae]